MSVLVRLKADDDALKNVEAMLHGVKGGVEKVTMRAINRALGSGKTALSKGIRETYTVNAATVNETISIRKASASNLEGIIVSSGKPLSARHFSHSPEGKDTTGAERKRIRVTVKKGGGGKFKTGFIWDGGWGTDKHAIYIRSGGKIRASKGYHAGKRYKVDKVKKVSGPSVPQMAGNDGVRERVQERVQEVFVNRLDHEVNRILKL